MNKGGTTAFRPFRKKGLFYIIGKCSYDIKNVTLEWHGEKESVASAASRRQRTSQNKIFLVL